MARKSTPVPTTPAAPSLNIALLSAIVAATGSEVGYMFVGPDAEPLATAGLIEVNMNYPNPQNGNEFAARATDEGKKYVEQNSAPKPETATDQPKAKPTFAIITNAAPPPRQRPGRSSSDIYPFDQMEKGHSFFVPATEKRPNPAKTMVSTISAANDRYATETGEYKEVTRKSRKTGEMETKRVPVKNYSREFTVRPVEAGKKYGEWVAPSDGALVIRTA